MSQRLYEGDHPDVAISLNNLAADLRGLEEHARRGSSTSRPGDVPAAV